MKSTAIFLLTILLLSFTAIHHHWLTEKHKGYSLLYTSADSQNKKEYVKLITNGEKSVQKFFHGKFKKEFTVAIHPHRQSLDSTWQKDWKMPDFKSECWMVASGSAEKLDMISPKLWKKESCEHDYANAVKTQRLITHELVHVYHGQYNISPDFSEVTGIDWFVEGLATYASGQCDAERITEVKKLISEEKVPPALDKFWTGKLKYGLSGSMVMYVDYKYGRTKLMELLKFNTLTDVLAALKTTESELMSGWKQYMMENQFSQ